MPCACAAGAFRGRFLAGVARPDGGRLGAELRRFPASRPGPKPARTKLSRRLKPCGGASSKLIVYVKYDKLLGGKALLSSTLNFETNTIY